MSKEEKQFVEFPKSMYRGEKHAHKAEHAIVNSAEEQAQAEEDGFIEGRAFFAEAPVAEEPKKRGRKAKADEAAPDAQ